MRNHRNQNLAAARPLHRIQIGESPLASLVSVLQRFDLHNEILYRFNYKPAHLSNPNALSTTNFTALGPQPERMTGCSGCFDYTTTEGRVNAIAVDPTTTVNGSIV